ncbi:MAG: MBL fold metallo-hydrolase, partial [Allobaculum sp.]|nr:MBL fold metallo-hydrolase [Allobaculum sp.]
SYIIHVNDGCWVVDCGDYPALKPHINLPVKGVLLTHGHFDHICGLNELLTEYPFTKVYTNLIGFEMLLDARKNLSYYHDSDFKLLNFSLIQTVNDRDRIYLGDDFFAEAVFTPGHNPSCITWIVDDYIFTGDSFIPGTKIITKLPGGNKKDAEESLHTIIKFSKGMKICPGHYI